MLPKRFPILDYATELIDLIVFHVTSTSDLLHLALTCRALCRVIIPSHLEFRRISCGAGFQHVWEYLSDHPAQARMVRILRVIGPDDPVKGDGCGPPMLHFYNVPACLWFKDGAIRVDEEKHDSEKKESSESTDNERAMVLWEKKKRLSWSALCCAVKQMTFLEEFFWTQFKEIPGAAVFHLVSTLKNSCPNLKRVTAVYADLFGTPGGTIWPDLLLLKHFSIWTCLPATLTRLDMFLLLQPITIHPEILASAVQLIAKSEYPNLRFFNFNCTFLDRSRFQPEPEVFYALFKNAHWPKLESLSWDYETEEFDEANFDARPWKDICECFFRRHPLISSLKLPMILPSTALLGDNTNVLLSNLKTFNIDGQLSQAFETVLPHSNSRPGSDIPQNLVSLSCAISPRCVALLERLPNLRYFVTKEGRDYETSEDTLRSALEVLGTTTKLEGLEIRPSLSRTPTLPEQLESLLPPKSSSPLFPYLTHFRWSYVDPVSISDLTKPADLYLRHDWNANVPVVSPITYLLMVMPNLKYVNVTGVWMRVTQSPSEDTGEVRVYLEAAKSGEVAVFDQLAWQAVGIQLGFGGRMNSSQSAS